MSSVAGLRILVVEDEAIIAMTLEDALMDAGAEPVMADTLDRAFAVLTQDEQIDAAVLDVNVHGRQSYDLARQLSARSTPFVFATGYGDTVIPLDLAHIETVTKPYDPKVIARALGR